MNVDEIEKEIQEFVKKVKDDGEVLEKVDTAKKIEQWLTSTFRKYLINQHDELQPVRTIPADAPDWMKKAKEEGKELDRVMLGSKLKNQIGHLLDWMFAEGVPNRLSVPDALKHADEWTIRKEPKVLKTDDGEEIALTGKDGPRDVELQMKLSDGHYVVLFTSEKGVFREGEQMDNCMKKDRAGKDYWKKAQAGKIHLMSIRQADGKSIGSFEIAADGEILQMKGYNNAPMAAEFHKYLIEFLRKSGAVD